MPMDVENFKRKMQPLLAKFEKDLGYTDVEARNYHEILEEMHLQAARTGIPYTKDSTSLNQFIAAVNFATLIYPSLPFRVRVYTGIFTWLLILVDDQAGQDPEKWIQFVPRYHAAAKHTNNAVAQALDNHLRTTYQHYPTVVANYIVADVIRFINASCIEGDVGSITRTAAGQNWPEFYRKMNGIPEAYIFMSFPKQICPDLNCFIEAIADMCLYITFCNDVLSFYKEECVGEKDNYLSSRAYYEGVGVVEVWETVADEVVNAYRRVQTILEGRSPYTQLWNDWAMGYVKYHKISARYRLHELGLGDSLPEN
ncbi:isoprenoid synthase domain-containing protein [Xylaria arbuscula]|nr:isoprenoid synthase domain-containing protein [Xylaria arbuscula]